MPATFSWPPSYVLLKCCFPSGGAYGPLGERFHFSAMPINFLPAGSTVHNLLTGMINFGL